MHTGLETCGFYSIYFTFVHQRFYFKQLDYELKISTR